MASRRAEQERRHALALVESPEALDQAWRDQLAVLKRGGTSAELSARRQILNCNSETCYCGLCEKCRGGIARRGLFPELTAALWDIGEEAREQGGALALITVIDQNWTRPRGNARELDPPAILRRVDEVLKSSGIGVGFIAFELAWNRWRGRLFRSCWQGHAHGVVLVPSRWQALVTSMAKRFNVGPSGAETVRLKSVYDLAGAVTYCMKLQTTDTERFETWKGWDKIDHPAQPWMCREHACALAPFRVGELVKLLGLQRRGDRVEPSNPVDDRR